MWPVKLEKGSCGCEGERAKDSSVSAGSAQTHKGTLASSSRSACSLVFAGSKSAAFVQTLENDTHVFKAVNSRDNSRQRTTAFDALCATAQLP